MSSDDSAVLVRRYFAECVQRVGSDRAGAMAAADELLAADFVMFYNNDAEAAAVRGRKRHKAFLVAHERDLPSDRWTVEGVVADEEVVACRWRFEGTDAATGNPIDVRAADFFTTEAGRLAELRRFLDFESFHDQLRPR